MAINDAIIAEMEDEAKTTKRVFESINNDKLSWKPHTKSRTLGQLALHIAQVPMRVTSLVVPDASEVPPFNLEEGVKNREELLKIFEQSLSAARENLSKMDDKRMKSSFTLQKNGKVVFTLPRELILRKILLNHSYHHRGQLSVYLRLLDIPVPSIYGPSADDNPFGT